MSNANREIELTSEKKGDVLILRMKGRLDAGTAPLAAEKVEKSVTAGDTKILINFSGVNYISSAGISFILSIAKNLEAKGGTLVICSIRSPVQELLSLVGVDCVVSCEAEDEQSALSQFS